MKGAGGLHVRIKWMNWDTYRENEKEREEGYIYEIEGNFII